MNAIAARAAMHYERGNIGAADVLVRAALQVDARDAAALNLRARMALAVGRPDVAAASAQQALEAAPHFKPARKNLEDARLRLATWPGIPAPLPSRLLVIRTWGCGFWSDVYHVLGMCLLAEYTGRTPVVLWGNGSWFRDPGVSEAWCEYFEPVSPVSVAQAQDRSLLSVFPSRWKGRLHEELDRFAGEGSRLHFVSLLGRDEPVLVSDFFSPVLAMLPWAPPGHWSVGLSVDATLGRLMKMYARPRPEIESIATHARDSLPPLDSLLSVHFRGTDKVVENDSLPALHDAYTAAIDASLDAGPASAVLLITDSRPGLEFFASRYGARLHSLPAIRAAGSEGVHYSGAAAPSALAREVLRDVLVASGCGAFIGTGSSNVSTAVVHRRDWPAGRVRLLDRSLHDYEFTGESLHGPL